MLRLITATPECHILTSNQSLVDSLLALNTHNRKQIPSHIEMMADEMSAGRWYLTNQGIGVTKSGWLCDGQNRLEANRLAGYPPISFVIVTGLEDEAQVVVDQNAKRRQSDILTLVLNRTVSIHVVAAANILLNMRTNDTGAFSLFSKKISSFDLAQFVDDNKEVLTQVMPSIGSLRAAVAAAILDFATRNFLTEAATFAEQVRKGLNLTQTSPAHRLRLWLDKNKGGGGHSQELAYSVTVTACIAHARNQPLSLLKPSSSWDQLPKKQRGTTTKYSATLLQQQQ